MLGEKQRRTLNVLIAVSLFSFSFLPREAHAKKKKAIPQGTPVLWRAPENIDSRNLYLGPGGVAMKPHLRRIKFIKEEKVYRPGTS